MYSNFVNFSDTLTSPSLNDIFREVMLFHGGKPVDNAPGWAEGVQTTLFDPSGDMWWSQKKLNAAKESKESKKSTKIVECEDIVDDQKVVDQKCESSKKYGSSEGSDDAKKAMKMCDTGKKDDVTIDIEESGSISGKQRFLTKIAATIKGSKSENECKTTTRSDSSSLASECSAKSCK